MKYSRYLIAFFILCFLIITSGFAQEDVLRPHGKKGTSTSEDWSYKRNPFIIGVEGGLNINMFSQTISWNIPPNYPHGTVWDGLKSANGLSPHFGVLIDVPINRTFNVQLRTSYETKNYGVTTSGTDFDGIAEERPMNLKVDVTSSYITLTPLLRINATDKLFFIVGPTFHFLSGDIETTWSPTSLDGITPLNNFSFWNNQFPFGATSGSITVKENQIQKSTRVGLEAGLGYKIPLSKSIYLVPQGRFQLMFTPVTNDIVVPFYDIIGDMVIGDETSSKRMVHTIQLALALWFEI